MSRSVPLYLLVALFALLIGTWLVQRAPSSAPLRVGAEVPDFHLLDLAGQSVALSDLRGQAVFLNFWGTWCAPCRDEAPSLERLYQRLHEQGLVILAISIDAAGSEAAIEDFRREFQLSFPILLDPHKEVYQSFRLTGVPETFLIDPEGRLVERFIGPRNWDEPRYARAVTRVLAPTPETSRDG